MLDAHKHCAAFPSCAAVRLPALWCTLNCSEALKSTEMHLIDVRYNISNNEFTALPYFITTVAW